MATQIMTSPPPSKWKFKTLSSYLSFHFLSLVNLLHLPPLPWYHQNWQHLFVVQIFCQ